MTRDAPEEELPGFEAAAGARPLLVAEHEMSKQPSKQPLVDRREAMVAAPRDAAFAPITRLGGETGWYFADWLWRLRGLVDAALGGVGMRRGHPDRQGLSVGDEVDFWRVEAVEPDRLLRFVAEMKVPGRAWLQFEVSDAPGGTLVRQTAIFHPQGLFGLLYWYFLYPVHAVVFAGLLRGIAKACLAELGLRSSSQ